MAEDPATHLLGRGQVKSLIAFAQVLLTECGERCGVSTARDAKTVTSRIEHEGLSFLTITLPSFASDLQKGLDAGELGSNLMTGFRRQAGLPRFLGGFLSLIFDAKTARLLESPSVEAVRCLRQFCMAFGKIRLDCTPARERAALLRYIECEKHVREYDLSFPERSFDFRRVSTLLFGDLFSHLDRLIAEGELTPKHGDGSTADHLLGNEKWSDFTWTRRLDSVFPVMDYLVPTYRDVEILDRVRMLEPRDELPVKVALVPKTLKTPRIIAMEPTCMMFVQQALFAAITDGIQRDDLLRSILGYLDPEPNRQLARKGSIDGSLATLDLSEASDRVSNQHVIAMTRPWTNLYEALQACRSTKADVPGFGVIRLAKFASMGSATCFPMEAMVFTTIAFLGIEDWLNRRLTRRDLRIFKGQVRVYGDDIIVPADAFSFVTNRLTSFGMVVNTAKSYGSGYFRESCGGDYFMGVDVTPVRVRRSFPTSRLHTDEIVSTVSLRNQLASAGWRTSVEFLDRLLPNFVRPYRQVPANSPALGRVDPEPVWAERMHPHRQVPQIKAPVKVDVRRESNLDGYGALLKFLWKHSDLPSRDPDHLRYAGRPVSARIKTRWVDIP